MEYLQIAREEANDVIRDRIISKFEKCQRLAEIYYAYNSIHKFVVNKYFLINNFEAKHSKDKFI